MTPLGLSIEERFWVKVRKDGPLPWSAPHLGPCWIWTACLREKGYGGFGVRVNGKPRCRRAHRIAYEWLVGPIPDGMTLDHLCRIRNCVNPDHLEVVSVAENLHRGFPGPRRNEVNVILFRYGEFIGATA